jgi:hypothetical protein
MLVGPEPTAFDLALLKLAFTYCTYVLAVTHCKLLTKPLTCIRLRDSESF